MCKNEIRKFEKNLRDYGREITSSKERSEEFLLKIGVTTKTGSLSKNYSELYIQPERG